MAKVSAVVPPPRDSSPRAFVPLDPPPPETRISLVRRDKRRHYDARKIACGEETVAFWNAEDGLVIWDVSVGVRSIPHTKLSSSRRTSSLSWNTDAGTLLLVDKGDIRWDAPEEPARASSYDFRTGARIGRVELEDSLVRDCSYDLLASPDGSTVCRLCRDRLTVWDARTGAHRFTALEPMVGSKALEVTYAPDGATLAVVGIDAIRLYRSEDGTLRGNIDVPPSRSRRSIRWPGTFIATAWEAHRTDFLELWDPSRSLAIQSVALPSDTSFSHLMEDSSLPGSMSDRLAMVEVVHGPALGHDPSVSYPSSCLVRQGRVVIDAALNVGRVDGTRWVSVMLIGGRLLVHDGTGAVEATKEQLRAVRVLRYEGGEESELDVSALRQHPGLLSSVLEGEP